MDWAGHQLRTLLLLSGLSVACIIFGTAPQLEGSLLGELGELSPKVAGCWLYCQQHFPQGFTAHFVVG